MVSHPRNSGQRNGSGHVCGLHLPHSGQLYARARQEQPLATAVRHRELYSLGTLRVVSQA